MTEKTDPESRVTCFRDLTHCGGNVRVTLCSGTPGQSKQDNLGHKATQSLTCSVLHSAFPFVSWHRGQDRKAAILLSISQEKAKLTRIPHGKDLAVYSQPYCRKTQIYTGRSSLKRGDACLGDTKSLGCDTVVDSLTDYKFSRTQITSFYLAWLFLSCR